MYLFGLRPALLTRFPIASELAANISPPVLEANIIDVLSAEIQDISTEAQVVPRLLQSTPDPINVDSVYTDTVLGVDI